jgi:hypothetical protein
MKQVFKWFDPFSLFGQKVEFDLLIRKPLKNDETLRLDDDGCFYLFKVPKSQAAIWDRFIFKVHLYFNKSSHLEAIDQAIFLFDKRISSLTQMMQEDYQEIKGQIECLKSLRNDYGFTFDQEYREELDQKLQELEQKAYVLLEKNAQVIAEEQIKQRKEKCHRFIHEAKAILILLNHESIFGLQEVRRILTAFSDDVPFLLKSRLHNIQARLLLAQDLYEEMEVLERANEGNLIVLQDQLKVIQEKLSLELNNLEYELGMLVNNLKIYYTQHPQDSHLHDYFPLICLNSLDESHDFATDKTLHEKIEMIQDHLDQLAA